MSDCLCVCVLAFHLHTVRHLCTFCNMSSVMTTVEMAAFTYTQYPLTRALTWLLCKVAACTMPTGRWDRLLLTALTSVVWSCLRCTHYMCACWSLFLCVCVLDPWYANLCVIFLYVCTHLTRALKHRMLYDCARSQTHMVSIGQRLHRYPHVTQSPLACLFGRL